MNRYSLYKQVHPTVSTMPFIIIETMLTSDGYRTRICDQKFDLEEVAKKVVDAMNERNQF